MIRMGIGYGSGRRFQQKPNAPVESMVDDPQSVTPNNALQRTPLRAPLSRKPLGNGE